jgi:hypothetical protein
VWWQLIDPVAEITGLQGLDVRLFVDGHVKIREMLARSLNVCVCVCVCVNGQGGDGMCGLA